MAGALFKKWIALLFEELRPEVHFKPKETGFSALKEQLLSYVTKWIEADSFYDQSLKCVLKERDWIKNRKCEGGCPDFAMSSPGLSPS